MQSRFEAFSPSQKREYIEWINEAKTEETQSQAGGYYGGMVGRRKDQELEI